MRRQVALTALLLTLLAGCSGGGNTAAAPAAGGGPASATGQPSTTAGTAGNAACSGGLHGGEPGVVSVTCDGPADIRVQVAGATHDLRGGQCRAAADVWSATVGVIIDVTGLHGTYAGPPVDTVTVNNTATAGKATIQAVFGDKHYFDLGNAALTRSADGKTAHVEGTGDRLSDAPGAPIIVDVTC